MKKTTEQFLKLLFDDGETVSVSPNQFGYHSIDQEDLNNTYIKLRSTKEKIIGIREDEINLICMNPVNGFRKDDNITAFRTFLVEMDDGSLDSQKKYIKELKMPYSVCVFSGNKSLHFGIVMDEPYFNKSVWKTTCQWILNIMSKADQKTKNPSRSIRYPNNIRKDGKRQEQKLIELGKRISKRKLASWLIKYPECQPETKKSDYYVDYERIPSPEMNTLPKTFFKIRDDLKAGVNVGGRNSAWFYLSCTMARKNFSLAQIKAELTPFFREENDFKYKEFLVCLESGYAQENK